MASSISSCEFSEMPALPTQWCNQYTTYVTLLDDNPQVYLGDADSVWNFKWSPSGTPDPETSFFTISGFWNKTESVTPFEQLHMTADSFRANVKLKDFHVLEGLRSYIQLRLIADHVYLENVTIEAAQYILMEENWLDYNMTITDSKIGYHASIFSFPSSITMKQFDIVNSEFELVLDPDDPTQETHDESIVLHVALDTFRMENVKFFGTEAVPTVASAFIFIRDVKSVDLVNVTFENMAAAPLSFVDVRNISIVNSSFYFEENAADYGCNVCSEGNNFYTNYSGVSLKSMIAAEPDFPTLVLINNTFVGVTAFTDGFDSSGFSGACVVDNKWFLSGFQAKASPGHWLELTNNLVNFGTVGIGHDDDIFPSFKLGGKIVSDSNTLQGNHPGIDTSCRVIFDNAIFYSGWLAVHSFCVAQPSQTVFGALTVYGYLGGYQGFGDLTIGSSSVFQLHGSLVDSIAINSGAGSFVGVFLNQLFDPSLFARGATLSAPSLHVTIPRHLIGVRRGVLVQIFNDSSAVSLSSVVVNELADVQKGYAGTLRDEGGLMVLEIESTRCDGICRNNAPCDERFTNCSCTGDAAGFAGAYCACTTFGLPGPATCDESGAQAWVISSSWDFPASSSISIPQGYEFRINGNCTLSGSMELSNNTTFITTGTFQNLGNITLSSDLRRVDLGGGQCLVVPSTSISAGDFSFDPQGLVNFNFDATSLLDASACNSASFSANDVFRRLATAAETPSVVSSNGSATLDGTINVEIATTPTTNAKIIVAKAPPNETFVSSTLLLTTSTSSAESCSSVDGATPGLLSIVVSPCLGGSPTPSNKGKPSIRWWWYGIPVIITGVAIIVILLIVFLLPRFQTTVLPYRGTMGS
jgi:hypothetical protein